MRKRGPSSARNDFIDTHKATVHSQGHRCHQWMWMQTDVKPRSQELIIVNTFDSGRSVLSSFSSSKSVASLSLLPVQDCFTPSRTSSRALQCGPDPVTSPQGPGASSDACKQGQPSAYYCISIPCGAIGMHTVRDCRDWTKIGKRLHHDPAPALQEAVQCDYTGSRGLGACDKALSFQTT